MTMASNGNINRGIQLVTDVIDFKMLRKVPGQWFITCTPYKTT